MVEKIKNPLSFYLASIIIILYCWRLVPFGDYFNIFLALSILLGIKENNFFNIFRSNKISIFFYFIVSGIFISVIYNSFQIGSFNELLARNSEHTHLKYKSILEGIGLFVIIILNINSFLELEKFMNFFTISSLFFVTLSLLGISESFIINAGFDTYFETYTFFSNQLTYSRSSFQTLDENVFGSLLCISVLFSSYFTLTLKNRFKFFYFLCIIIFTYCIVLTVSRTAILRLILQTISFLLLIKFFSQKNNFIVFILLTPLIIFLIFNNPFDTISFRFTEVFSNLNTWFDTGQLISRDSFQYRLLRSLIGVPETISGWFFGSGGVQTARIFNSADHIEYTNWLWQYGLITFVPLILFLLTLIKNSFNYTGKNVKYRYSNAVCFSLIFGTMISMIGQPLFFYLWISIALGSVMVYFSNVKINE